MKKKIIIIASVLIAVLVLTIIYKATVKKKYSTVLPDKIIEIQGYKQFSGADWGGKSIVCEEGGFNILNYAGKKITIQSSLAAGKFYKTILTPLNVHEIYADGKMICKYYSDSTGLLVPGLFAINDPDIIGQK